MSEVKGKMRMTETGELQKTMMMMMMHLNNSHWGVGLMRREKNEEMGGVQWRGHTHKKKKKKRMKTRKQKRWTQEEKDG